MSTNVTNVTNVINVTNVTAFSTQASAESTTMDPLPVRQDNAHDRDRRARNTGSSAHLEEETVIKSCDRKSAPWEMSLGEAF